MNDKMRYYSKSPKDLKIEEQASYIELLTTQVRVAEEKLEQIRQVFADEQQPNGCDRE